MSRYICQACRTGNHHACAFPGNCTCTISPDTLEDEAPTPETPAGGLTAGAVPLCDHYWAWVSPAGTSESARLCMTCHQPDPEWLNEIAAVVQARAEDGHTRSQTDAGPDYCAECSEAVSEWIAWPCSPAAVVKTARDQERMYAAAEGRDPESIVQARAEDRARRDRAFIAALHEKWDGLPGRIAPHIALSDVRAALTATEDGDTP